MAQAGSVQAERLRRIGAWVGEQMLLGFLSQIAHFSSVAFWAHVGGFGMGMLLAGLFIWVVPEQRRRDAELGTY